MLYENKSRLNKIAESSSSANKPFSFRIKPFLMGLLTFIILGGLFGVLAYQRFLIVKQSNQKETHEFLNKVRTDLHEFLEEGKSATSTLSFFIHKEEKVKDFDSIASFLIAANKNIDALELVPGGFIEKVYPLVGNERLLGYNILKDSTRNKEALKAVEKKRFFYAGPLQLKQGGVGIVGRMPVFKNDVFWGFSAVVIKLSSLLRAAGIDNPKQSGYYCQFSKINPDTRIEENFMPPLPLSDRDDIFSVFLPDEEWQLSAVPVNANKGYTNIYLFTLLGCFFSMTLGFFAYIIAKRPEKLNELVQLRTVALQKNEEKYRSLIEQASDGIVIINAAGNIIEVNKSVCRMTGYKVQELLGKSIKDYLNVDGVSTQPLRIMELVDNNALIYERRIQRKDSTIIDVEVNSKMAGPDTFIGFIRDITERKQAEVMLEQSEIKYRSLFEQASDGIMITDLTGKIVEVNSSICNMGNYTIDEMIGKHVNDFMPVEDITGIPLRIADLLQGKTLMYERRMLRKDGTILDVEINSKMTIDKSLIGFIRDITERKLAVLELKNLNERHELISKATNDAIWDYSFITNETLGNENLYNLYGLTRGKDKIDAEVFASRIHPDDWEQLTANFKETFKKKADFLIEEYRFKTQDGKYKYFYDRACVIYNKNGDPERIIGIMQDISGRIKIEQKLLKEKELSDSIINNLPGVFFLIGPERNFLRWNKNLEIVSGYSHQEITPLEPFSLFPEPERNAIAERIANAFVKGADSIECNFLQKNMHLVPCYITGVKVEYEGETCLMGFGLDFSDKVASEKKLKENEEKFRCLVEHAADSVIILNEEGYPSYVSPSLGRILGYKDAELMQMNVSELTHPDEAEAINKVFQEVMQNPGVPIKGHYSKIRHKDGSWRWFEDTITNMLHIPAIKGIVENVRDVTEKLEIERRIINEKELSDTVINGLPGIFYLYDKNGKFIRWNKNFETVTGYSADEISRMTPLDFYDDDLKDLVKARIDSNYYKQNAGIELELLTKAHQKIPFYINSLVIKYEEAACVMGMGIDVTDRRKIEQELIVSNRHLEQKATALKNSFAELEQFAYIVSHDLQEPLRMVSSFLILLEKNYKSKLDERGEKYIHFAVDGAERMKQLIMDLLEYSRTGTNKDIPSDTDMNEVLVDLLNVLRNSIKEHQAVMEVDDLPILPNTSRVQMFQLMQNLIGNALKYHGDKKLLIKIKVRDDGNQWIFSVQDNGIGIDPKYFEKIFVIFQRLHSRDEFSGTGIGLAICKKIVDKLGGKIWVESKRDVGSTFYFSVSKGMA